MTYIKKFQDAFAKAKVENRPAFMPFLVAGYPNYNKSLKAAVTLAKAADMIEIGFPFSDPLADGPVISRASGLAIARGMDTKKCFMLVGNITSKVKVPITIMTYANIVLQYGIDRFYEQAAKSGASGVLLPDVPVNESKIFARAAAAHGVAQIFLVGQTTPGTKVERILKAAKGFLYLVSVLGVTGARKSFPKETIKFIKRIAKISNLPIAVGFGISNRHHVKQLFKAGAHGVVVGSSIIQALQKKQKLSSVPLIKYFREY